jgi:hypothetical protein
LPGRAAYMLLQLVYKGRRGGLAAGAVFSACVLDEPDAGVGQVAEQRIELSPEGAAGGRQTRGRRSPSETRR